MATLFIIFYHFFIGYGLPVDMWALGVITYILLCGFPPFRSPDRNQDELFELIQSGKYEYISPYWNNISSGKSYDNCHVSSINFLWDCSSQQNEEHIARWKHQFFYLNFVFLNVQNLIMVTWNNYSVNSGQRWLKNGGCTKFCYYFYPISYKNFVTCQTGKYTFPFTLQSLKPLKNDIKTN